MAEFISGPLTDSLAEQAQGSDAFQSTTGEVLGARVENAWNSKQIVRGIKATGRAFANGTAVSQGDGQYVSPQDVGVDTSNQVHPEDANAQAKQAGVQGLNFTTPMEQSSVKSIIDDHVAAQQRQSIIDRRANSILTGSLAGFGVDGLVGLADPVNIAAMFVPGAPEAFVAEKLGLAAGGIANRAVVGATQGAAGMAALAPLDYSLSKADMNDFSLGDTLRNIAFGAGLGGVLHAGLGALFPHAAADPEVREAALKSAIAQIVEGKPVDVAPILEAAEATAKADALAKPKRPGPFEPAAEEFFGKPASEGDLAVTDHVLDAMAPADRARYDEITGQLADEATPPEQRAALEQEQSTLVSQAQPAAEDALRQKAQAAAQDMVQRAREPSPDPEIVRSQKANAAAIESAPKFDGKLEDHIAEATKLAQEAHEAIQTEIAAGRLHPETGKAEFEAAKNLEGDGKAAQAAAACLISRGF